MKKSLLFLMCICLMTTVFAGGGKDAETQSVDYSEFPTKPVEATVQWNAGGGGDLVYRALAEVFPKYANGQPLVIKNVGGASGVTGSTEFMNAKPDGYQIIHVNTAHYSKMHMSVVPYDAQTFVPVAQISEASNYLLVQNDAKWKTLEDFIADAKANPGMITIGNAGIGGGNHLGALIFEQASGAEFSHIAFNGGSGAVTGILSGEVDAIMSVAPEGLANAEAGDLRVLATFGSKRFDRFPEVPTAKEAGLDITIDQWRGAAAPPGTSSEAVAKLDEILKKCLADEQFIQAMKDLDAVAVYKDANDFAKFVSSEDQRYMNLIKSNGLGDRY